MLKNGEEAICGIELKWNVCHQFEETPLRYVLHAAAFKKFEGKKEKSFQMKERRL